MGLRGFVEAAPTCHAAKRDASVAAAQKATFYELQGGGGNCSFPAAPANGLFVALPAVEYAGAAKCGGFLDVRGPKGTVRVEIIDQCPECAAGHIDLGKTAFAKIAAISQGEVPVSYHLVADPPLRAPLAFRVKEGSSAFFLDLLPIGTGNPVAKVEVSAPGHGTVALERQDFGYWEARNGLGPGPFTVRLTDSRGHVAVAHGIRLRPGVVQTTSVLMYGKKAAVRHKKKATVTSGPPVATSSSASSASSPQAAAVPGPPSPSARAAVTGC
jgi:expansin (peptidoglycan-binding protein)